MSARRKINQNQLALIGWLALLIWHHHLTLLTYGQLPDDIQRELNQNLAEQARIQAQRARHQQLIQSRMSKNSTPTQGGKQQQQQQPHDPNNYSYQQVSPPIQYSYYQPYGDLAKPQQQAPATATDGGAPAKPINIDLNNLNFDDLPNLPAPQAQMGPARRVDAQSGTAQRHLTPSFTGAGGLPVLQPVAASQMPAADSYTPTGQAPLPPQAQQGPPLTEADFKDITGGENYGAPGGSDFGMGSAGGNSNDMAAEPRNGGMSDNNDDAQLREFGMPDQSGGQQQPQANGRASDNPMQAMGMGNDFGADFNPMGASSGGRRTGGGGGFDPFSMAGASDIGGLAGMGGGQRRRQQQQPTGEDFDFTGQPSNGRSDQAQAAMNGAAPGSLQSLLGNAFPGLGGGQASNMGLDGLARGQQGQTIESQLDSPQRQQRADDGSLDIADLGDKADGFSGADLGGFEQPTAGNDQDFNYAAAAEQQPRSVPYPDGSPQFVGTLWAMTQPQSLSQTRYNPLPDKGTYQDYPAYKAGGNDFEAVRAVVDGTPKARPPGAGRYGQPSPSELAPEYRDQGDRFNYSQAPQTSSSSSKQVDRLGDNNVAPAGVSPARNNIGSSGNGNSEDDVEDFF